MNLDSPEELLRVWEPRQSGGAATSVKESRNPEELRTMTLLLSGAAMTVAVPSWLPFRKVERSFIEL